MPYVFLILGGALAWASSVSLTVFVGAFALKRFRDNAVPWALLSSITLLIGAAAIVISLGLLGDRGY